jgi:hypothetical protein
MSRPTAISPEEQEQIARRIGVLLLQAATDDWQQITVEYRATGDYHDLLGEVATADGGSEPWEPPDELVSVFEHLREGMYRPDVGTWLSALYVVERPSSYRIDINFDTEPQWNRPLPRAAYVDELRRYPRGDDNVPDWMRAKLDGSGTTTPQAESAVPDTPQVPLESAVEHENPGLSPFTEETAEQFAEPTTSGAEGNGIATTPAFRRVQVFDGFDEQGRPMVATRVPVPPEEIAPLRQYLETAPIVLTSRDAEKDQLDPQGTAAIPATWHTDGSWLWPGTVAFYLSQYGVPPEPDFVEHIRSRRFTLPEIDEQVREAAANELRDAAPDTPGVFESARFDSAVGHDGARAEDPQSAIVREDTEPARVADVPEEPEARPTVSEVAESTPTRDEEAVRERFDEIATESALDSDLPDVMPETVNGSRHDLDDIEADVDDDDADEADEADSESAHEDPAPVLAQLHDKLMEHGVDASNFRIGSHSSQARCLINEGPDWIVTAGAEGRRGGDVRFAHAEDAAAYLLGSLLLSRPAPEQEAAAQAPATEPDRPAQEAPAATDLSRLSAEPEPSPPSTDSGPPEQQPAQQPGGHFLFTANQGPPPEQLAETAFRPDAPDPAVRHETPDQQERVATTEEPTRFQQPPRLDRPAPPTGPPSPPAGQPMPPTGPPSPAPGQPAQAPPAGPGPGSGQAPPPLPKRPPRPDQGAGGRPPERQPTAAERLQGPPQPGPGGPGPVGGAARRPGPAGPGPAGPPRQGAVPPGGAPPRPPHGGPGEQQARPPQPPGAGREQQIQPLRGEPPLTLYRDRRPIVLQPGTEVDRFGDPTGNVTYAARTPYSQRSLPPQWSSRAYVIYRVQRPIQVLRGTAVPWFEQPGGGTAYVLPTAVNDLLADGTLVELSGNEAPPRPMD